MDGSSFNDDFIMEDPTEEELKLVKELERKIRKAIKVLVKAHEEKEYWEVSSAWNDIENYRAQIREIMGNNYRVC